MSSLLGFQAPLLRAIADGCKLSPVSEMARRAGIQDVYRITIHLFDGRACDSVSTLCRSLTGGIVLETVYQRALLQKPITHRISDERYDEFVKAVKNLGFDHLGDQPKLPGYDATDLWLVERAAGTYSHNVILAPELARDAHGRLANAIKHGLPEVLRMVK